jgi:hypothetical protein
MKHKTQFFELGKTPPTPAMFFSPKGLKSPFEQPEKNV